MRVLLVEDEPRAAQMLAKGLREQSYAVDIARNGRDALYQVAITEYDAVVLDVMLPGVDGFEVCRELRREGSNIPGGHPARPVASDACGRDRGRLACRPPGASSVPPQSTHQTDAREFAAPR
jgi:CheY-like chemotaxis protein